MNLFSIISANLLLIFAVSTALAHPNQMASLADYSLQELMNMRVVTATKTATPLVRAPATMVVVTGRQIKDRGYETLLDLIEDQPGVDVFRYANEENGSQVTLRGNTGNNKFLILADGVTISAATGEEIPLGYNYPLYMADRVELIFGPGSALYGADAFTGVINIISDPEIMEEASSITLTGGSDLFSMGSVTARTSIADNIWVSYGGHLQTAENPNLASSYPEEYATAAKEAFGAVFIPKDSVTDSYSNATASELAYLTLNIDERFTLGLRHSFEKHPTSTGVRPSATIYGDQARWETRMRNLYGKYRFESPGGLSGETLIAYSTYEVLPQSGYQNMFVDFERLYKYAKDSGLTFEQQINYDINGTHVITTGLVYEDLYSLPKTPDLPKPFSPTEPAAGQDFVHPGTPLPLRIYEMSYQNYGLYLQLQSAWSKKVFTTAGVRFDDNSRYGSSVNPRGGLVFLPTSEATIKLMYGESYLAPSPKIAFGPFGSFFESSETPGTYESWFFHVPSPSLKPEKSRNYEINASLQVTPDFFIFVSGHYTLVDDIIIPKFYNSDIQFAGATVHAWEQNENVGSATIYGGDISLNYKSTMRNGDKLSLWSNYTYTTGDIDEGGGVRVGLPFVVQHKIKGGATWRRGDYAITPRIHVIGKQSHQATEKNDNTIRQAVDGYTLVYLTVRADNVFHRGVTVALHIRNLFDERYYNAGGKSAPTASFIASPQDPRTVKLGLTYQF